MKSFKLISLFACLFYSSISFAGMEWKGPFTVQEAYQWSYDGYAVTTVKVNEVGSINSGCSLTDNKGVSSYFTVGETTTQNSQWLSALLTAQAQNKKIMIYMDGSTCSAWAGALFNGIKVITK